MFVSGLKTYTCKFLIGTKRAFSLWVGLGESAYREVLISRRWQKAEEWVAKRHASKVIWNLVNLLSEGRKLEETGG
jgi:hypothetical protein